MISIGKAINSILSGQPEITNIISDRIYPVCAPEETKLPYVVFQRNNVTANYSNDGVNDNTVIVEITVVSSDYSQSVDLAEYIRQSLELRRGVFAGINIKSSHFTGISEDWADSYIQTLTFTIKAN